MRAAGYRTAFIGKWQQGGNYRLQGSDDFFHFGASVEEIDFTRPFEDGPLAHGFDHSVVLPNGIQAQPFAYFVDDLWEPIDGLTSELVRLTAGPFNGGELPQGGMGDSNWDSRQASARLAGSAVEFIDAHARRRAGTGERFFLLYMTAAIHKPWTPPETFAGTAVAGATGAGDKADMLLQLDLEVGAILDALEERGLTRETLILFTSDNGGIETDSPEGHDSAGGLRGWKGEIHEGAHRVPFIAKWGDGTAAGSLIAPGSTCDELIGIHDYVAALYDLTRQDMPDEQALDSANLLPVLLGQPPADAPVRKSLLVQSVGSDFQVDGRGIRQYDWSLISDAEGNALELYDLTADPSQEDNLIDDPRHAALVDHLQESMQSALVDPGRTTPAFRNP
jgi:arylsulfatase A-like enzyme